jgi:peptidoglycan/LPS O-acetylase OafA/YrhL
VFLFFALSGFLIGRMWWPRASSSYPTFVARRALRIYPAFAIAFAASLAFAWHSGTWHAPDLPRVAGNLLFLNGAPGSAIAPFNVVTWSLFYEMTFYLAFPLLLLLVRREVTVATAGIVAPAIAALAGADPVVLCWSLLFFGVLLAAARRPLRVPAALVVVCYFAITTAAMLDLLPVVAAMLAFGAVAILIVGTCLTPGNVVSRVLSARPLRALGRVSYSFYLVHWMIVVLVARAVEGEPPLAAAVAIFGGGFLLSAIAATVSWRIAEQPYFRWRR